jgi:lipopolysaccharide export system protein LptC
MCYYEAHGIAPALPPRPREFASRLNFAALGWCWIGRAGVAAVDPESGEWSGDAGVGFEKTAAMVNLTDARQEPANRLDLTIPERTGAVRHARIHSARVRFLRFAILGSCSAAVLILGVIAFFDPFKRLPQNISIGGVGLEGTRVTIDTPKIVGHRKDGLPYDVRAATGYKDILKPDITELVVVDANVGMADGSMSRITSKTGVHDAAKESVFLKGAVKIKNPTGYELHLSTATMLFNAGSLITDDPVEVLLHANIITADRMEITDNGHKMSFIGHVKSIIKEEDADAPEDGAAK